jgi:glycosyltransferase involved in cell wall biosynthesis
MKVKVIESMAHGIPVVSTGIGLSGIRPGIRKSFMIADTPKEFAALLHRLISDKTLYLDYCNVMKQVFHDHFDTKAVTPFLDGVFGITPDKS